MNDQNNSLIDSLTGGNAIEVKVNIDLQSIALLVVGVIVSIVLGQIISASILK
jgi:hypothetical protein